MMRKTMRNKTKVATIFGAILLTAGICSAQGEDAKPAAGQPKYFHLDFVVKELDNGKVINARHYSTTTATGDGNLGYTCTMRSGSKVPVPQGGTIAAGQFTYIDVGVNIDCRSAKEIEGSLAIGVTAEISNAAPSSNPPLIRQTKWSSNVIVPIGKPTVIFSSDDVTTKGQMQLELTATAIPAR
jgi:hypothetical protein